MIGSSAPNQRGLAVGILVIAVALCASGCATVVRGSKDTVRIESNPSGASIHLSTGHSGVTPAMFELPRKNLITVEFEKEGFDKKTVYLYPTRSKKGSIAAGGNALVGGAIGGAIDGSTGAMLDLEPNPLVVTLELTPPPPTLENWSALKVGLTRRDVKRLIGTPAETSDDSSAQIWSYANGAKIYFKNFFVDHWTAPSAG